MGANCKHVVAALLTSLERRAAPHSGPRLPYALSSWLDLARETVDTVRKSVAAKSTAAPRLMYVLVPDGKEGRVNLYLCKARTRADGSIASATVGRDSYSLLNYSKASVDSADVHALRLFVSMVSYSSFGVAVIEPRDEMGNHFLRHVLDAGKLGWAEATADFKTGLIRAIAAGPARAGGLGWADDGAAHGSMRLGWQFDDGEPAGDVLATRPPM